MYICMHASADIYACMIHMCVYTRKNIAHLIPCMWAGTQHTLYWWSKLPAGHEYKNKLHKQKESAERYVYVFMLNKKYHKLHA